MKMSRIFRNTCLCIAILAAPSCVSHTSQEAKKTVLETSDEIADLPTFLKILIEKRLLPDKMINEHGINVKIGMDESAYMRNPNVYPTYIILHCTKMQSDDTNVYTLLASKINPGDDWALRSVWFTDRDGAITRLK
jgi:hypothetical protein